VLIPAASKKSAPIEKTAANDTAAAAEKFNHPLAQAVAIPTNTLTAVFPTIQGDGVHKNEPSRMASATSVVRPTMDAATERSRFLPGA
jgi:hypothetical protein